MFDDTRTVHTARLCTVLDELDAAEVQLRLDELFEELTGGEVLPRVWMAYTEDDEGPCVVAMSSVEDWMDREEFLAALVEILTAWVLHPDAS